MTAAKSNTAIVLAVLENSNEPKRYSEIKTLLPDLTTGQVSGALNSLLKQSKVVRLGRGVYTTANYAGVQAAFSASLDAILEQYKQRYDLASASGVETQFQDMYKSLEHLILGGSNNGIQVGKNGSRTISI